MNYRLVIAFFILIIGLGLCTYVQHKKVNNLKEELSITSNNLKSEKLKTVSWIDKYNKNHSKSIEQQTTIDYLKLSNDSFSNSLKATVKQYDIALRKLKAYGEITTTIKFDTIIDVDTSLYGCHDLSNEWIKQTVCIENGSISSSLEADSKDKMLWTDKRETVLPPRKFFLRRWFQKRHDIISIEIIRENPLFKTKSQTFTIIK